jgi:hypothetical protein
MLFLWWRIIADDLTAEGELASTAHGRKPAAIAVRIRTFE